MGLWGACFFSGRTTVFPSSLQLFSPDSWLQMGRFLQPAATFCPDFLKRKDLFTTGLSSFRGKVALPFLGSWAPKRAVVCWVVRVAHHYTVRMLHGEFVQNPWWQVFLVYRWTLKKKKAPLNHVIAFDSISPLKSAWEGGCPSSGVLG